MSSARKAIAVLAFLLLLPFAAFAGDPAGVYAKVPGFKFNSDGKTVEVIEFLSFYCHTCYDFEQAVPAIKGNFPKKLKWKVVPLHWGPASPKPGEAYLLAVDAGKGDQMKKALFNAHFVEKKDIGNVEVLEKIAVDLGLGFDFSRKLRSGEKSGEVQKGMELAQAYAIEETPSFIIAGNLKTSGQMLNHDRKALKDNIITIIKDILKK